MPERTPEQSGMKRIPFENFQVNEEGNVMGVLEERPYELVYDVDTEDMAIRAIRASMGRFPTLMALGPAVVEQPKGSGRIVNIDLENGQNLGDRWVYMTFYEEGK